MADRTLRELERKRAQGDPQVQAQTLAHRARYGQIPHAHISYAAHLGCSIARLIDPKPHIVVSCSACERRREERSRRNRDPHPQPTPLRETPRDCMKCRGSEQVVLDRGLIAFVKQVDDVPQRSLIAWAADCAEHQADSLFPQHAPLYEGRYLLPVQPTHSPALTASILPAVREWLVNPAAVPPVLYQHATTTVGGVREIGVVACLSAAVALAGIEEEARTVRWRTAEVASASYHAAGGTRTERAWQEQRLIQYLLGEV